MDVDKLQKDRNIRREERKESRREKAIIAAGQACLGLGHGIAGLAKLGLIQEAMMLANSLKNLSFKISMRLDDEHSYKTSGKTSDKDRDSAACKWLAAQLDTPKKAVEILELAEESGFTKTDVFEARKILELEVTLNRGLQVWSLPKTQRSNP